MLLETQMAFWESGAKLSCCTMCHVHNYTRDNFMWSDGELQEEEPG